MSFDSIHNYYERQVIEEIQKSLVNSGKVSDSDELADIACVALNQLPTRYVRHQVDLVFYLTGEEQAQMRDSVIEAVRYATDFVRKHRGDKRPDTITMQAG